jgi:hypothetical protein
MSKPTPDITEEERQMILLALAHVALARPGWSVFYAEIAEKFDGRELFEDFKRMELRRLTRRPLD